jgi:hypothetical protein
MREGYDFSSGRRGSVILPSGKTRITIMLDNDVLDHFRAEAESLGIGYQTRINAILRNAMADDPMPLTAGAIRKIVREELSANVKKRAA